jgi:hypothetical protein
MTQLGKDREREIGELEQARLRKSPLLITAP